MRARSTSAARRSSRCAHSPHASDVGGPARARAGAGRARRGRSWRRRSWPGPGCRGRRRPRRTGRTASRRAAARAGCAAASTLARSTVSSRSGVSVVDERRRRARRRRARPRSRGCSREQRGERVAVGDVARGDGHRRRRARSARRRGRRRRGRPGPRRLTSSSCATPCVGDQMPGDGRAEAAGAAGDQDGAVRQSTASGRAAGRASRGTNTVAVADGHLRLVDRRARSRRATCRRASRSTSVNRPGCSACADRTRPHTAAPARSVTFVAADRAPGDEHEPGRGSRSSASQACTSASTWCVRRRGSRWRPRVHGLRWHVVGRARRQATPSADGSPVAVAGVHSRPNSQLRAGRRRRSAVRSTGRTTSDSHVDHRRAGRVGRPARTPSSPAGVSRTRSAVAPVACRVTPLHANGSRASVAAVDEQRVQRRVEQRRVQPEPGRVACPRAARPRRTPRRRAASRAAGPGTPARSRSRSRRARRRARRRRPGSRRPAATRSVRARPPRRGGDGCRWRAGSTSPSSGAGVDGDLRHRLVGDRVTWSRTAPSSSTSGACRVSSSRCRQSTWSPARIASSTNAVPGTRTVPATAWSASHGCVRVDSRPVNTMPPVSGSSTAAPSSGCSAR